MDSFIKYQTRSNIKRGRHGKAWEINEIKMVRLPRDNGREKNAKSYTMEILQESKSRESQEEMDIGSGAEYRKNEDKRLQIESAEKR